MELVFPTIEYKDAALDFRQEHFDCGEIYIHGSNGLHGSESYENWLEKITWNKTGSSPEWVTSSTYFAVVNGGIIGIANIRHRLNEFLLSTWGHIGYGVRPSQRRKGYATQILALALTKCRGMGIERVLVSCDKDNIASAKTIMKNGGILENEFTEDDGNIVQQFWISF